MSRTRLLQDGNALVAAILFVVSFGVYAYTTSPSPAFWDSGEFVATAYSLGIPHQPGTPLYVLVGRVFSLLAIGLPVAQVINMMSGLFASLAVVLMYLTGVRLQQGWQEEQDDPSPNWLVRAAAAVGAGFLAFSHTFWVNAIEAEVYSLAAFVLALSAYLAVRWYDLREQASSASLMLFIVYVMGLSIGFHMGSILVYPGLLVLVLLSGKKALDTRDVVAVSAFMGAFVVSTMSSSTPVNLLVGGLVLGCLAWGIVRLFADAQGFVLAGIGLFVLGLSVHLFLLIRAAQDPMINESDPHTLEVLLSVLRREQYPPRSPFDREAPILWQLGHLWGSSLWQSGTLAGRQVVGYLHQFRFLPGDPGFIGRLFEAAIPVALWLYGLYYQWRGHKKLFLAFFVILLINSIGLMIMLNFTDHEVRDRDYFYFGAFQFAALFLGLGAGGVLRMLWRGWRNSPATVAAGAAMLLFLAFLPVLLAPLGHQKFFEHNRRNDRVARNYGYNMLVGLPQDAIIFTNGDNDTFPLWYLQEVEHFRQDVRVVNLSLINLAWYIKQVRDYEPSVRINWTDRQLDAIDPIDYRGLRVKLQTQWMDRERTQILWVRDMVVWKIIQDNFANRPIYFAVTVPSDTIGEYMALCSMEGLVYRVTDKRSETGQASVNRDAILTNMTELYDMSGVVTADWKRDDSVYKERQTAHLLHNYTAALCRVAYQSALDDDLDQAARAMELAYGMDPTFSAVVELLPMVYLQAGRYDEVVAAAEDFERSLTPGESEEMLRLVTEGMLSLRQSDRAKEWMLERLEQRPCDDFTLERLSRVLLVRREFDEAETIVQECADKTGGAALFDRVRQIQALRKRAEEEGSPSPVDEGGQGVRP